MAYSSSYALERWLTIRRQSIDTLADAHAIIGEVDGPGRPRELGRPLGHAYVLRVVAEFQGFARDLHDLAAEHLIDLAGTDPQYLALLTTAVVGGRWMDRGNADLRSLEQDFRRLGIGGLKGRLANRNAYWAPADGRRGDQAYYQDLVGLRNALAHGNQQQLDALRNQKVMDTVTWARARLPGLNRTARALDRIVWDDIVDNFGSEPW